jgi:hypothetical protein
MKASIHSRDAENKSSFGKAYRVASKRMRVRCADGVLLISASENEMYHPARSNTVSPWRDVDRILELELTPREIGTIVNAALRAGLVRLDAKVVPKAPEAQRHGQRPNKSLERTRAR